MEKVKELRARALECKDVAMKAPDDGMRMHYEALAVMWERLASQREVSLRAGGEPA